MSYEKLTSSSPEAQSASPIPDHVTALASLFPSVVREGKVDFDALRQLLGDEVAKDDELFGLQWKGKAQARRGATTPSLGTLRPCKEESVDWDTTNNLYLEGDNLEVLKLLRKSYAGKVKMIYIDPPYNTGKEFVYPDNYQNGIEEYKKLTGQLGGFKANAETSGRYHTDWLNMMYPRLILAKDLLSDEGVICISMDDHEISRLLVVCDEIFGENNFLANFVWKRRASSAMALNNISTDHEYVIAYQKGAFSEMAGFEKDFSNFSNPDNDPNGPWVAGDLTVGMGASLRPNQAYDLVNPKTGMIYPYNPNRVWAFIPSSMEKLVKENKIIFPKDPSRRPMQKRYKKDLIDFQNPISTLLIDKVGLNTEGTRIIQTLFEKNVFDYSKPVSLIHILINQITKKSDIVLDFFSGSSASAHAVMNVNMENFGKRQFIMVQLPETYGEKNGERNLEYETICDLAKERIRRAGKKIKEEAGLQGQNLDIGFRVYKLDSSNLRVWNPEIDDLELALGSHEKHLLPERTQEDLLYEILLKQGIELTEDARLRELGGKRVYSLGHGQYYACMETVIYSDHIEALALGIAQWKHEESPDNTQCAVFVIDESFRSDADKLNFAKILEQHGIPSVKAL